MSSATATLDSPSVDKTDDVFHRDFGFLPIPKYLRHDPSAPVRFDLVLNVLFGVASTVGESQHLDIRLPSAETGLRDVQS